MTRTHQQGLLVLLVLIVVRLVRGGLMRIVAVATMALVLVAQFADELSSRPLRKRTRHHDWLVGRELVDRLSESIAL